MKLGRLAELAAKTAAFALFAALFRYNVRFLESRAQFIIFAFLVVLLETTLSGRAKHQFRLCHVFFPSIAAAIAIVSVKWGLEGMSPLLRVLLTRS